MSQRDDRKSQSDLLFQVFPAAAAVVARATKNIRLARANLAALNLKKIPPVSQRYFELSLKSFLKFVVVRKKIKRPKIPKTSLSDVLKASWL